MGRTACKEVRLSWIRHLPSIFASSLLFGLIGTPLGTLIFFAILLITADRPVPPLRNVDEFMLGAGIYIAIIAGAAPAFLTGIAAGILRIYIRSLALLACLMAPIGAVTTTSYIAFLKVFFFRFGLPKEEEVIWTGGVSAFCCAFLLWRNRPWTISPRQT
jgi:hypothetical protein